MSERPTVAVSASAVEIGDVLPSGQVVVGKEPVAPFDLNLGLFLSDGGFILAGRLSPVEIVKRGHLASSARSAGDVNSGNAISAINEETGPFYEVHASRALTKGRQWITVHRCHVAMTCTCGAEREVTHVILDRSEKVRVRTTN
ncbi:hypothetical protein [Catellatospora sp. NPDC049609]|uniref:hypothetical protein n=1 Tax=Catellatospora sp. NPDC049609 TaxID=3155505 RepID=UPI00343620C6